MGLRQHRQWLESPARRGSTEHLPLGAGHLVGLTGGHSSLPAHDLKILDSCGPEGASHAAEHEANHYEERPLRARSLRWWRGRIDHGNYWSVVHFLHPCRLILSIECEIELLPNLNLAKEATFFKTELR